MTLTYPQYPILDSPHTPSSFYFDLLQCTSVSLELRGNCLIIMIHCHTFCNASEYEIWVNVFREMLWTVSMHLPDTIFNVHLGVLLSEFYGSSTAHCTTSKYYTAASHCMLQYCLFHLSVLVSYHH